MLPKPFKAVAYKLCDGLILCLRGIAFLFPFKLYLLPTERLGHLSQEPDLLLRQKATYHRRMTYILVRDPQSPIANAYLFQQLHRYFKIISNGLLRHAVLALKDKLCRANLYENLPITQSFAACYASYSNIPSQLHLPKPDCEKGKAMLAKHFGVDVAHDKIICLFARDASYLKNTFPGRDWSYHDCRDIDPNTYLDTIDFLVNTGFKVFRMGKLASDKIQYEHPHFIDYAFSDKRSDFLDVYIMSMAYLVIGQTSGLTDLATVFERPFLSIGQVDPIGIETVKGKSLFIPKKIYKNDADQCYFPIDIKNMGLQYFEIEKLGFRYEDNTAEEILLATKEMLLLLDGQRCLSEEDEQLIQQYHDAHWRHYQLYSRINSPIAVSWLKQYQQNYFCQAKVPQAV